MTRKLRCFECAEYHEGDCDEIAVLAWRMDCMLDALDELLDLPSDQE
jgi:hypothetical protein